MAKRYYISPITYTEARSENVIAAFEMFNRGQPLEGAEWSARSWVPPSDISGRITGWCLVWIDTPDHAPLLANGDLIALPADLGSLFGSLRPNERNQFNNRITSAGLVVQWNNETSIREVIVRAATQMDPGFNWASWSGE